MPEVTQYNPGTFCWLELATTDAGGARKFYTELFGWTANDVPAGPDIVYTIAQLNEKDVAALYQQQEEQKAQGIPPHWLSYVSVANADESAEKAGQLGGNVIMGPFDVFDIGRMAVVQDPTGATFALWQPRNHIGARIVNEPGAVCWNELATSDTSKAAEFYGKLFGWATKTDTGSMPYTEFLNGNRPVGGMMQIQKEWGEVPPHWLGYFAVADCDKSVERAKSLGAAQTVPPTDIPNVGRFAVLRDPQGAVFAVIKLTFNG